MSDRTEQLRRNLETALDELYRKKSTIKDLEIAFQEEIENVYTDVPWWKVTNYWDIFNALFFENKSAEEVIDTIVSKAEEYENEEKTPQKNESIEKSKSLKESVAGKYSERIWDALEEGALSYQEVAEAAIYYLSDDEVEDLARTNDLVYIFEDPEEDEEEEDEEDLDWDFKESKSKDKKESKKSCHRKVLEKIKPSLKSKKSLKEESIGDELAKYQKWVDYDMKRYGKISDKTKEELKDAGLELVKDQYGDYEVIAKDK